MVIKGAADYETKTNGDFMLEFTYDFFFFYSMYEGVSKCSCTNAITF